MGLQTNLYRRGAAYVWRRRIPVHLGGTILQISLRTNDPLIARRLGAIVSAESNSVFDTMTVQGLSREHARKFLEQIIVREMKKIAVLRSEPRGRADTADDRAHDWAIGTALKMISETGCEADPLTDQDAEHLRREGRSEQDIDRLRGHLERQSELAYASPNEGPGVVIAEQLRETLGRKQFQAAEYLVARQLYIAGRGAAYLQSAHSQSNGFDGAMQLAEQLASPTAERPAPTPTAAIDEAVAAYDPAWSALVGRFSALKTRQKVSAQMIDQMAKVFQLFAEATGVADIRNLRQTHLAQFVDVLRTLPQSYRKSTKDKDKSLKQILNEAKAKPTNQIGLSDATINRNLNYLGQLFTKGASEGYQALTLIDASSLRPRKSQRDRDVRAAYSVDDVQAILRHPVWQGSGKGKSWNKPGTFIEQDGLYWLPIIAALTGARRAEIAGLMPDEIEILEGIPTFRIKPNRIRGLKTLASTRDLPLHPQLVELGLVARATQLAASGSDLLFPDLRTPNDVKLGDKIDYKFRMIAEQQLGARVENKSFHSFRHYVTTQLTQMEGVPDRVIKDIIGHTGNNVTSERYTQTTPSEAKLAAIRQLPRLPITAPDQLGGR
ncbi:MAG: hypothetical protein CFE33_19950 [Pseudorhodobacter sp. PARRP1]|nr:MAG: hypothetical protein CFE33_19950 [Pseudorhodobacter sp. PARRP1]